MPTVWRVLLWMGCFEAEMKHCLRGVIRHPFFVSFLEKVAKRWPKLGYKRKKILRFHSFRVTCKISLVPGTGLEPALLSEHAPETCASTNSATRAGRIPISRNLIVGCFLIVVSSFPFLVPRTRLELARLNRHYPLKVACLPIPPPGQSFS